jgi:urease gamma subunit
MGKQIVIDVDKLVEGFLDCNIIELQRRPESAVRREVKLATVEPSGYWDCDLEAFSKNIQEIVQYGASVSDIMHEVHQLLQQERQKIIEKIENLHFGTIVASQAQARIIKLIKEMEGCCE